MVPGKIHVMKVNVQQQQFSLVISSSYSSLFEAVIQSVVVIHGRTFFCRSFHSLLNLLPWMETSA